MFIGRIHRAIVLSALICAGFPSPGEAQPSACPDPLDAEGPAGVVWQGRAEGTQLRQLAHLLAPVLWFSSDEPLLVLRQNGAIPHAHPCDGERATPVVYYQATDIVLRSSERVQEPADDEPRFFEKVDHFVLRYFFYYDEDWGLGRHAHDLEVVNVYVYLDQTGPGCYRVRVPKVEGLAHGLDWYSNILRVERDTAFPIMILIEEGKHASCPDRNADGIYTPGYDVNVHVNDAWGLRDVLGSSMLLGASYSASMSKPREPRFRLFPPESGLPICPRNGRRTEYAPEQSLGRYHLRPATTVPACRPRINERNDSLQ
jgi:hypothetical protein